MKNDFALSLALKWRLRWTRKWPILNFSGLKSSLKIGSQHRPECCDTSGCFLRAPALKFKINYRKVRMITKNTAEKQPPARTFFCFTDILFPLAKYQHIEIVEEGSIYESEQKFKVSTSIFKFVLKIDYFVSFMLWKLFFKRNIPTSWSVKFTASV